MLCVCVGGGGIGRRSGIGLGELWIRELLGCMEGVVREETEHAEEDEWKWSRGRKQRS